LIRFPNLRKPDWIRPDALARLRRVLPFAVVAIWLLSGFYTVQPEEQAVVKRFGRIVNRAVPSGMHVRWPWPIESHEKFETTTVYKMGIGMITRDFLRGIPSPEELSHWLTGDTNILSIKIMIQYTIVDLPSFLYHAEAGQFLMAKIAEAELTEILGGAGVDEALTVGRALIAEELRRRTQARLDELQLGIAISSVNLLSVDPPSEVIDVFRDVANAAADRERIINEANGYASSLIPRARGEAQSLVERAHAERDARISQAEGEASRFAALVAESRKNPKAARRRLYLETMESVLPNVKRYVVDAKDGAGKFNLKILDLPSKEAATP
jgi:membrane protease subunit HflK